MGYGSSSGMGSRTTSPSRARWAVATCVVVLALLATVLLAPILRVDAPVGDDFTFIARASGELGTLEYWFTPHNGHRLVLPKLLQGLALSLSGQQFWAPRFLGLAALAASTALFLKLARELRGELEIVDVALPVLFLGPRLVSTFVHAFDLQFALHTTLVALALWCALRAARGSPAMLGGAWLALVALVFMGMNGLVAAAVFAPFVGAHAFDWEDPGRRRSAKFLAPLLVGAIWLGVGLMMTWETARAGSGSTLAKAKASVQFLAMALGPAGAKLWPATGVVAIVLLSGLVAGLGLLVRRANAPARETSLLVGAVSATLAVALAVGYGRAGWGGVVDAGLGERFTLLSVAVLALSHLVLALVVARADAGVGRVARRLAWVTAITLFAAQPFAFADARRRAGDFRRATDELARRVRAGAPISELMDLEQALMAQDRGQLASDLALACEHRLGPYRNLERNTASCSREPFRTRQLELGPGGAEIVEASFPTLRTHEPECDGDTARFGPSCTRAAHALCKERGFDFGFGPVESAGPLAVIVCARGRQERVAPSELGSGAASLGAAHRWCGTHGARAGAGVPPRGGELAQVVCFEQPHAVLVVDFSELERKHGSCFSPAAAESGDCAAAIHRLCRERGGGSGFGPVAVEGTRATIVCL